MLSWAVSREKKLAFLILYNSNFRFLPWPDLIERPNIVRLELYSEKNNIFLLWMFDRGMKYPVIVMRQSSKWNAALKRSQTEGYGSFRQRRQTAFFTWE